MAEKKKADLKKVQAKPRTASRSKAKSASGVKTRAKLSDKTVVKKAQGADITRVVNKISPPRILANGEERKPAKNARANQQYAYMKAPGMIYDFQVGDRVEVFCDHEKGRERVRGWIAGIVVQVDNKMVAVQFRSNVFLTDGWMVPDRILWYPLNSEHIRPVLSGRKSAKKEKAIPDF